MDRPIRIGVKPWPPSAYPCFLNQNHSKGCFPGIELEVLLTLLDRLGIQQYTLHSSLEPGCGELDVDDNGTVRSASGLMAMLLNGEIDMTGIVCSYNHKRSVVFGTVWPLIYAQQVFVMKAPEIDKQESDIRRPLAWENWCAIFAVFAAIVFVRMVSALIFKDNLKQVMLKWIRILLETAFGLDLVKKFPKGIRLHVILLFLLWQFCDSCMKSFYATEIKSTTTSSSIAHMPFKSATELAAIVERGRYKLMNHVPKPPISITNNEIVQKQLQNGFDKFGYFFNPANSSIDLYTPLLQDSSLVFPTFDTLMQQNMLEVPFGHELTAIRDRDGAKKEYTYYFSRNNPLRERFNRLLSSGAQAFELVYRVRKRYLWKTALEDFNCSEFEPLKLAKMHAIFQFLGAMWTISVTAFLIERACYVMKLDANHYMC